MKITPRKSSFNDLEPSNNVPYGFIDICWFYHLAFA